MTFYLLSIIWSYCIIFFSKKFSKFHYFFFVTPLVLFSTFRGLSGPDTINYLGRYLNASDGLSNVTSIAGEPVTYVLMYVSNLIFPGEFVFFNFIYALILSTLFYILCRNFDRYKYFMLFVGPVLIIDGLTNTIRVSLAYFLFLYAYTSRRYFIILTLSFFSHVSTVIMIVFKGIIERFKYKFSVREFSILIIFIMILCTSLLAYQYIVSFFPRISEKLDEYNKLKTSSSLSGISDIFVIFFILLFASIYNRDKVLYMLVDFVFICIFSLGLYYVASFSIGFLRLFKIIIICLSMSPFLYKSKRKIPSYLPFIIGFLYTLNYLRIVYFGDGYLPYGSGY